MGIQGIIRPPSEIRAVANKTASFVAKNGRGFESRDAREGVWRFDGRVGRKCHLELQLIGAEVVAHFECSTAWSRQT